MSDTQDVEQEMTLDGLREELVRAQTEISALREQKGSASALIQEIVELRSEVKRLRAEIETMNARNAMDAKSYERDKYLIARLREQLAADALDKGAL